MPGKERGTHRAGAGGTRHFQQAPLARKGGSMSSSRPRTVCYRGLEKNADRWLVTAALVNVLMARARRRWSLLEWRQRGPVVHRPHGESGDL